MQINLSILAHLRRQMLSLALCLLAAITLYYFYCFLTADSAHVLAQWEGRWHVIVLAVLINVAGVTIDFLSWRIIYRQFAIRLAPAQAVPVYLSLYAAQLAPAQLGRLIRPQMIKRLGLGHRRTAVRAEALLFYLDLAALLALMLALLASNLPQAMAARYGSGDTASATFYGAVLGAAVLAVAAFGAVYIVDLFKVPFFKTPLFSMQLLQKRTPLLFVLCLRVVDWAIVGLILHLLIRDLPGTQDTVKSIFTALTATLFGGATTLPGGLGATEGFMGLFLRRMQLPPEHLALAIGLFRLITFWLQIPFGWLALLYLNRTRPQGAI